MNLTEKDLINAVNEKIINQDQLDQLIDFKKNNSNSSANFLYYSGALLIISAMTWLMASSWDSFGGIGIFLLSIIYMLVFGFFGQKLYDKRDYKILGGLLFTITLCITPLALFGLLKYLNIWNNSVNYGDFYIWIKGKWIILEIGSIIVGLMILKYIRFPFLLAPISFALWFFSMDIVPIIFQDANFTWTERKHVSLIFGTIYVILGYIIHKKTNKEYSFWIYFFGLLTLVSSLSIFYNDDTLMFLIFFLVNLIFVLIYLIIEQKVFLVFGIIGIAEFLGRLSFEIFEDSPVLPFIYTAIGILIIIIGINFQRNNWGSKISEKIPKQIKSLKP